jgi:hypothetical protein
VIQHDIRVARVGIGHEGAEAVKSSVGRYASKLLDFQDLFALIKMSISQQLDASATTKKERRKSGSV